MFEPADIDSPDPVSYTRSTLYADTVLKELGFRFKGTDSVGKDYWLKSAGHGIWHSVIVDKDNPNVNYRQVRVKGRGVLNKEFQVIHHRDVPVSEVRRILLKWSPGTVAEALEAIHELLDDNPDAFDPRADLERLVPHRCPACGSSNLSVEADDEGLLDCFDCGIWFNPLHPANSPVLQQENAADPDDPVDFINRMPLLNPRIRVSYSQTTPESAEAGDFSESGWIDEEGKEMTPDRWDREEGLTAVDLAVKFLRDEGANETSGSHFHPGVWYYSDWQTDYHTGTQEERSYHLVDFSPEEEQAIWTKMHERQRQH